MGDVFVYVTDQELPGKECLTDYSGICFIQLGITQIKRAGFQEKEVIEKHNEKVTIEIEIEVKMVKILFEHNNAPGDAYGVESVWAVPEKDGYKLDNILFYAKEYSLGDLVSVEERSGELFVNGLLSESGHSTIRIVFYNKSDVEITRQELKKMGCESEISDVSVLISVDVPPDIDYQTIKEFLEEGVRWEKWDYEEACIAHNT